MKGSTEFPVHQETDRVASRVILRVAAAGTVVGAVGIAAAALLLATVAGGVERAPNRAPDVPARWPVEQTPIRDTQRGVDLREAQRRMLGRWGWVDRDAGVATVPIDESIDIVIGAPP